MDVCPQEMFDLPDETGRIFLVQEYGRKTMLESYRLAESVLDTDSPITAFAFGSLRMFDAGSAETTASS